MIKVRKGHSLSLECQGNVSDISNWKIRAEVYDKDHRIKLANIASGGSDEQIEILDNNAFLIKIAKGETSIFEGKKAKLITEFETDDEESLLLPGPSEDIEFEERIIDWEVPE